MGLEVRQSALRGAIQVCPLALSSRPGASTHSAIESQQGRALCFLHQEANRAPVAQMDRALASGAKGRGFEPLQARHLFAESSRRLRSFFTNTPAESSTHLRGAFQTGHSTAKS